MHVLYMEKKTYKLTRYLKLLARLSTDSGGAAISADATDKRLRNWSENMMERSMSLELYLKIT
jgi:hypothetical protein